MSTDHDHDEHDHGHHEDHDHHDHDHDHDHDQDDECRPPQECEDCDPGLIDDLACQSEGVAAQAAYNAEQQPVLKQASVDYATARGAYRAARSAATLEVQDLRHQVKQLIERIRCQIKQDEVVDCLDRAFRCVCRELDACGSGGGCCTTAECEVDKTCPDDYDELVSRIVEYEARVVREQACFTSLVAEPQALTDRVAAAKAEVDAINAELGGDPATVDVKKLYVSALVAQRHLGEIWNGFPQTQDYIDCLCRTLTCWTKTIDAVSVLTGCRAVADCKDRVRRTHCEDLATKTVEEVLLEYERLCGSESCDDDDDCPDEEQDDDCGCGDRHEHGHRDTDRKRDRPRGESSVER